MGRKKPVTGEEPRLVQIPVRVPPTVKKELEDLARRFGLDLSNFMRLLIRKSLGPLRKEAEGLGEPWK